MESRSAQVAGAEPVERRSRETSPGQKPVGMSSCASRRAGICRNVDLCKWAVWRAKPRAKRRERHPLLGMGAKSAIWRTKTRQKCPKRHPLVKMGAKRAIWQTKTRQKCPKRHPFVAVVDISSDWAAAICTGRFSVRFHHGRPRSGVTIDPRRGWARLRVERLAIGLAL